MKRILIILVLGLLGGGLWGQRAGELTINRNIVPFMIDECGDTLLLVNLDDVTVSSPRQFNNRDEYNLYRRYRRYAAKVYPYAVDAIRIFREVEDVTLDLNKRKRKKYVRELHRELKDEFTNPLKKLTKTQGMILVEMIEMELDTPMYFLIKDLRNGLTASYWGTIGKLYGHNLREGYIRGKDPILDMVLDDFDISSEEE